MDGTLTSNFLLSKDRLSASSYGSRTLSNTTKERKVVEIILSSRPGSHRVRTRTGGTGRFPVFQAPIHPVPKSEPFGTRRNHCRPFGRC